MEQISLFQYRNFVQSTYPLHRKCTLITGANGRGKTNLMDAIHMLGLCKSNFGYQDINLVQFGYAQYAVRGNCRIGETCLQVALKYQTGLRKELTINEVPISPLASHIGTIPIVMIEPGDIALVKEGSTERRRFLDHCLCQVSSEYLQALQSYQKTFIQANHLIKEAKSIRGNELITQLQAFVHLLFQYGRIIFQFRENYIQNIQPLAQEYYKLLSGNREFLGIQYQSNFAQYISDESTYLKSILDDLPKRRILQGIHRDDLIFSLNEQESRYIASQGQQKSILLSIKLAEYQFLKNTVHKLPILLLDDVLDKLDPMRIQNLLQIIMSNAFGQCILSDSHPDRIRHWMNPEQELLHLEL